LLRSDIGSFIPTTRISFVDDIQDLAETLCSLPQSADSVKAVSDPGLAKKLLAFAAVKVIKKATHSLLIDGILPQTAVFESQDLRLYATLCIVNVLRICAPKTPFSDTDLRVSYAS
jgi:hypothetical protein